MPSELSENNFQEIDISQLVPGMYVKSISYQDKGFILKSEGYIQSIGKVMQLKEAGIKKVIVDPAKQKAAESIDKVMPKISASPLTRLSSISRQKIVPFNDELAKAKRLYSDAKNLQTKIFKNIQSSKAISATEVKETTDAIVNSIFRNQDAFTCLTSLSTKGSYLMEHSINCAILMAIFAKHLKIDRETIEQLSIGAFLHDIGKVLLPNEILNKPDTLDDTEQKIVRSHVALGEKILEDTPHISHIVMSMVKEHHERLDGKGYPKQLQSADISKFGKMMAIVDSYDAMTSDRVYQQAVAPITAFKTLIKESETAYDEGLVEQFIQCMGVYPVGTLVLLNSGKIGIISQLNQNRPTQPTVKVFYNATINQKTIIEDIDLSQSDYKDQIDRCIRPEEFNLNLISFFKTAFSY
ncbi:HD-GYP domain-containing protein [Colwellia sp. MEBiC06753]